MAQKTKQWAAIIVMIALFAMIAFVTNLCSPMALIVKDQFGASNFEAQVGNYGNFIAYLVMGIPSGMLIKRFGYKKTALIALLVGIVGILVQWMSGWDSVQSFFVYLIGAFIAGFCMCMLNTVVNPMLNLLGGGGKSGNQLIQIGGAFNSAAAVAVYIIMGALLADKLRPQIGDATPALFIALGVFVVAFIVILFTKIQEPTIAPAAKGAKKKDPHSAFSFRHFNLGILAIFFYMGLEVGTPTYMIQYLSADNQDLKNKKTQILSSYEASEISADIAAENYYAIANAGTDMSAENLLNSGDKDKIDYYKTQVSGIADSIKSGELSSSEIQSRTEGVGIPVTMATLIAAVYWLMMFVGRLVGGVIGGKVSSRAMLLTVTCGALILVGLGMFLPTSVSIGVPGIDWAALKVIWADVPIGMLALLLVGLCTSVMWGSIFNLAVEGLGKYTSIASGAFMTMVFGCAVLVGLQGWLADITGSYLQSYWIVIFCAAYILFYALAGYRNVNKNIPVGETEE